MVPMDMPVCRKHVGYVSIDCKLMAKNVMANQNFTTIADHVAMYSKLLSVKFPFQKQ